MKNRNSKVTHLNQCNIQAEKCKDNLYAVAQHFIQQAKGINNVHISFRSQKGNPGIDKVKDRVIEVKEDGATQNIALVNHRLPEEQLVTHEEEIPPVFPTILPNTGKKDIIIITLLLSLSIIGYLYEKKHI